MPLLRENTPLSRAISISIVAISIVCVLLFTKMIVYPTYLYFVNKNSFMDLSTGCNIGLASTAGTPENAHSASNQSELVADQVALVACHEMNILALRLLANGVSEHRLRYMFLKSLEDERVPLWMLSNPPEFQWEK